MVRGASPSRSIEGPGPPGTPGSEGHHLRVRVSTQGGTFPGLWNRKRPGNASLSLGGSRCALPVGGPGIPSPGRASPRTHQGARSSSRCNEGQRDPSPHFCTLRVFLFFLFCPALRGYPRVLLLRARHRPDEAVHRQAPRLAPPSAATIQGGPGSRLSTDVAPLRRAAPNPSFSKPTAEKRPNMGPASTVSQAPAMKKASSSFRNSRRRRKPSFSAS